jgi:hypothetical protein
MHDQRPRQSNADLEPKRLPLDVLVAIDEHLLEYYKLVREGDRNQSLVFRERLRQSDLSQRYSPEGAAYLWAALDDIDTCCG